MKTFGTTTSLQVFKVKLQLELLHDDKQSIHGVSCIYDPEYLRYTLISVSIGTQPWNKLVKVAVLDHQWQRYMLFYQIIANLPIPVVSSTQLYVNGMIS